MMVLVSKEKRRLISANLTHLNPSDLVEDSCKTPVFAESFTIAVLYYDINSIEPEPRRILAPSHLLATFDVGLCSKYLLISKSSLRDNWILAKAQQKLTLL